MTTDAYDAIRRDVLARIERRRLRPEGDLDEVRLEVDRGGRGTTSGSRASATSSRSSSPPTMADRVLRSITDLGALTDLSPVVTSRRSSSRARASRTSTAPGVSAA